jgi:hypothetical protein
MMTNGGGKRDPLWRFCLRKNEGAEKPSIIGDLCPKVCYVVKGDKR